MLTKKEKYSLLLAMSIGDGHLHVAKVKRWKNSWYQSIDIIHSIKQVAYLEHKVELLHKILGGKKPRIIEFNNNGYPGVKTTKSSRWFRYIHPRLYKNRKKVISRKILDKLTPKGIAIWYMDDGGLALKKRNGKIHARELMLNTGLTREENGVLVNYFNEVWKIRFTIAKNNSVTRLRCGTIEAKKFIEIVKPYIIPSMQYKVDMKYN